MAKAPKSSAVALITLAALVAATNSAAGFLFATPASIQPLVDAGNAEINMGMANPANAAEFAARATPKGIAEAMTNTNQTQASEPAKPTFVRAVRPMTAKKRQGGGGQNVYPFDDLAAPTTDEAGNKLCDGFFVAATEKKPNPEESLQSAVSAATRRYATETGKKSFTKKGKVVDGVQQPDTVGTRAVYAYTRKFSLVAGEHEGTKGAWIERVQ